MWNLLLRREYTGFVSGVICFMKGVVKVKYLTGQGISGVSSRKIKSTGAATASENTRARGSALQSTTSDAWRSDRWEHLGLRLLQYLPSLLPFALFWCSHCHVVNGNEVLPKAGFTRQDGLPIQPTIERDIDQCRRIAKHWRRGATRVTYFSPTAS